MHRRIFFDLDGTLVDSRQRLYALFVELAPETSLSFADYWDVKRNRTTQEELLREHLNYDPKRIACFKQNWFNSVEDVVRLRLDTPFEGVGAMLQRLAQEASLFLVTARQNAARVEEQLRWYGWSSYFKGVFVTLQLCSKASAIRLKLQPQRGDVLVGDTGEDINDGKELHMVTIAVCSGNLCADILEQYHPDWTFPVVTKVNWSEFVGSNTSVLK